MEAGYRPWSHIEEFEVGKIRVFADLGSGNVMCAAGGMVWNSADGIWRNGYEHRLMRTGGEWIWKDGSGAERKVGGGKGMGICREGGRLRMWDGHGNVMRFSHDGRVEEAFFAGEGRREYIYSGGLLTAVQGRDGRMVFGYMGGRCAVCAGRETAFFEYERDRLAGVRFGDGEGAACFEYEGAYMTAVECGGERLEVGYDAEGRVVRAGGKAFGYFEGGALMRETEGGRCSGKRIMSEKGDGAQEGAEWRYFFDESGRCVAAGTEGKIWRVDAGEGMEMRICADI